MAHLPAEGFYATGTCFDDCADYIKEIVLLGELTREQFEKDKWPKWVHGIGKLKDEGLFSHSWIEEKNTCLTAKWHRGEKIWVVASRDVYYKSIKLKVCVRYTIKQAYDMEKKHGCAPWDTVIREYCKK